MSRRRRTYALLGVAAVLIFALAASLWVRTQRSGHSGDTEVLDLRGQFGASDQNPNQPEEHSLAIHRSVKHLILDLPFGSDEEEDEVALLSETGAPVLGTHLRAHRENQTMVPQLDMDVSKVRPSRYYLGVRHPGTEWKRYPVQVL